MVPAIMNLNSIVLDSWYLSIKISWIIVEKHQFLIAPALIVLWFGLLIQNKVNRIVREGSIEALKTRLDLNQVLPFLSF